MDALQPPNRTRLAGAGRSKWNGAMLRYPQREASMHGHLHAPSQLGLFPMFCLVYCTLGGVDDYKSLQLEE